MLSKEARLAAIAERRHSVVSHAQARSCGLTQDQIDHRVSSGVLVRVYRGVYRMPGAPLSYEGQVLAAVVAGGRGARASFTTAARLFAVEGLITPDIHVTVPTGRRVRIPGVAVHESKDDRDVRRLGVIPVTSPARTLLDIAGIVHPATLEDALDDLWRRDLVTIARCLDLLAQLGKHRGNKVLRALLNERTGKRPSGSGRENVVRRLIVAAGLPAPDTQVPIFSSSGRFIARPDLAYPDAKLYIEFDSTRWHATEESLARDHLRHNRLAAEGWLPFVVDENQLKHHRTELVESFNRALTERRAAMARLNGKSEGSPRGTGSLR
jgi:hypothetical protein